MLEGLRAALPHAEVVHADGSDLAAAAASAASADVAIVVVGYTRADEGEFIGDSGTTHLRSLLPGPDEPDVVAAFEARLPSDRLAIEGSIPGSDALGFSTGGDRERLTLHDADEQLIESVATANPRTVVVPRGGQRRADRGVASPCPRPRPDLVLGDAGWTRHR